MKTPDLRPCPCGLPAAYTACCGRWHAGPLHLQAPDAPALMRSRYTAYVLQRGDYLLDTWHASTRPGVSSQERGVALKSSASNSPRRRP